MAKEFLFRGKSMDELRKLSLSEFALLVNSRERRKITRGFTESEKKFMKSVQKGKKVLKTHCRDMIILPEMVDKRIKIHSGKEWKDVIILPEMLGHRLGEYAMTRKSLKHSSPGIGATRSSASLSVK